MKLKNKGLWVFAGGILLVLLLFSDSSSFKQGKNRSL